MYVDNYYVGIYCDKYVGIWVRFNMHSKIIYQQNVTNTITKIKQQLSDLKTLVLNENNFTCIFQYLDSTIIDI